MRTTPTTSLSSATASMREVCARGRFYWREIVAMRRFRQTNERPQHISPSQWRLVEYRFAWALTKRVARRVFASTDDADPLSVPVDAPTIVEHVWSAVAVLGIEQAWTGECSCGWRGEPRFTCDEALAEGETHKTEALGWRRS